jgi:hypothetical protein
MSEEISKAARSAVLDLIEAKRTGMYPWRVERATQTLMEVLAGEKSTTRETRLINYAPAVISSITMRALKHGNTQASMLTMPTIVRLSLDWLDKREVK